MLLLKLLGLLSLLGAFVSFLSIFVIGLVWGAVSFFCFCAAGVMLGKWIEAIEDN